MTYVEQKHEMIDGHYTTLTECPFGVRDLKYSHDECYSGNGQNRCQWFVKYDWEKHYGCIACNHPVENKNGKEPDDLEGQLFFDFDEGVNK